jgi:hypothetical protein
MSELYQEGKRGTLIQADIDRIFEDLDEDEKP